MLKFTIRGATRTMVGIGLTPADMGKMPVLVKLDRMGIRPGHDQPLDVLIMTGENEAKIMEELAGLGLIGEGTRINVESDPD